MDKHLLEAIVKHIFASFVIIPSDFIDLNRTKSIRDKRYLLSSQIKFEDNSNAGQVWGCQLSAESQELKILLGNLSETESILEYAMLIQLKNAPCYGLYLVYDHSGKEPSEPLIACSVNGVEWLQCNTFLQSSFLSGMEQVKETGLSWNKCDSYQEEFEKLLTFIEYHHLVYGEPNEGQENGL